MSITINDYSKRPQRTLESDGIGDMLWGLTYCGTALFPYALYLSAGAMRGRLFWESQAYHNANLFFLFAIFVVNAVIIAGSHGAAFLRTRFVTPRLGYVALPGVPRARRMARVVVTGIASLVLVMVMGWAFSHHHDPFKYLHFWTGRMTVMAAGVMFGVTFLLQFARFGFARHLVVAGISVVASILLANAHLGWQIGCAWLFIAVGVSLIISGVIPFVKLLRVPVATEQDAE